MGDGGKEDPSLAARNQLANSRVTIISTGNAGAAGFLTSDGPYPRLQRKPIDEHPDAGKTTLTEKLLLFGGAIQLAGEAKGARRAAAGALGMDGGRARARDLPSGCSHVCETDGARTDMALYWSG